MRVSAKTDYALRAAVELAAAEPGAAVKAEWIAATQEISPHFLGNILSQLRQAGLVRSRRGPDGGFLLARPAEEITVADVIRAIDGPLAGVSGERPQDLVYAGAAAALREVWIAVRVNLRRVLERVTLAQLAAGELPEEVLELTREHDAWVPH